MKLGHPFKKYAKTTSSKDGFFSFFIQIYEKENF
jgi:hypothetical protein